MVVARVAATVAVIVVATVATNYLMTELARSKLEYGLLSRVISCHDRSAQNCQNSYSKCAPCTRTQALRRRRVSRSRESDSVVFSVLWGTVLLKHTQKLVLGQLMHVWQWPLSNIDVKKRLFYDNV